MTFTNTQIREAYKKLSPEVQNFIMDNETTDLITNHLGMAGLSEEQSTLADSEILYAMLGLQTLPDAISNIAKLSNKSLESLHRLKIDLENNIFVKIPISTLTQSKKEEPEQRSAKPNNIGQSFEQIILNQARAMQKAVPPNNLPIETEIETPIQRPIEREEVPQPNQNHEVHNYSSGNDPYREPVN